MLHGNITISLATLNSILRKRLYINEEQKNTENLFMVSFLLLLLFIQWIATKTFEKRHSDYVIINKVLLFQWLFVALFNSILILLRYQYPLFKNIGFYTDMNILINSNELGIQLMDWSIKLWWFLFMVNTIRTIYNHKCIGVGSLAMISYGFHLIFCVFSNEKTEKMMLFHIFVVIISILSQGISMIIENNIHGKYQKYQKLMLWVMNDFFYLFFLVMTFNLAKNPVNNFIEYFDYGIIYPNLNGLLLSILIELMIYIMFMMNYSKGHDQCRIVVPKIEKDD